MASSPAANSASTCCCSSLSSESSESVGLDARELLGELVRERSRRILVAAQHPATLEALQLFFAACGVRCLALRDGATAVEVQVC